MHRYLKIIVLSLIFTSLAAFAAESGENCDAKLVAGDRYLGAVSARLKAGQISLEELKKIAASPTPLNPIKTQTPGSRNSAAIRLFDSLVDDNQVKQQWASTREAVLRLIDEQIDKEQKRERASLDTANLISPVVHYSVDDNAGVYSLTVLPDQRPAVAFVRAGHIEVVDLSNKTQIDVIPLPMNNLRSVGVEWHRDSTNQVWIYFLGHMNVTDEINMFRVKFGEHTFQRIAPPDAILGAFTDYQIASLYSAAPGHMIAITTSMSSLDFYFKLDSGKFVEINYMDIGDQAVEASPPPGINVQFKSNADVIFRTLDGRTLYAGISRQNAREIFISQWKIPGKEYIPFPQQALNPRLEFFEDGKHIYLAATYFNTVEIYEPFVSTKPIVSVPARIASSKAHWLRSPEGNLLFAVGTHNEGNQSEVKIIDVGSRSAMDFRISGRIENWATVNGQSYFGVKEVDGRKLTIYKIFSAPHR